MILVFASFIFGGQVVIKMFGLGLAAAVLMDALIVRMVLVPGLMLVIGKANWWLPGALDRILPPAQRRGHGGTRRTGGRARSRRLAQEFRSVLGDRNHRQWPMR